MRSLPLLILLALPIPGLAQDRMELVNHSLQPWTLALVEGSRPLQGSLDVVDKFTGRTLATLAQAGDRIVLPPRARYLAIYHRVGGYLFLGFILRDSLGWFAEYRATVEFLSSRRISVGLVGHHLGPPLDRAGEGEVLQRLGDLIEIDQDCLTIRPDALGSPPSPD
jgi:hypothetical protein